MSSYLADCKITVLPFTQQPDGEETIIANAAQTSFLSLPTSAVDILHWLAEDKTVAEAQTLYQEKYDELPDMQDFLELLESEGFVISGQSRQEAVAPAPSAACSGRQRYHFESFLPGPGTAHAQPPGPGCVFLLYRRWTVPDRH